MKIKKSKRLLSLAVAAAMFLSMGTGVFAEVVSQSDLQAMQTVDVSQSDEKALAGKTNSSEKTDSSRMSDASLSTVSGSNNTPEEPMIKLKCQEAPVLCLSDGDFFIQNGVLTGYQGSGGNVVIPDSVTTIGNWVFEDCDVLAGITLPNSVTSIGIGAFAKCRNLKRITIPDSVKYIDNSAFFLCTGLTSITIPNSVTGIGVGAFYDCFNLKSVTMSDSVTSIREGTFSYCTKLTSITIPDSVTEIGNRAFEACTSMTSITIPHSVTTIDQYAFYECNSLKDIVIPNSVTYIGHSAFNNCHSLASVTIPNFITSIDNYTFSGCNSLTNVMIPDSVTSIGYHAFSECISLRSVTIPGSVTSLDADAFENCSSLKDIYYTGTRQQWNHLLTGENGEETVLNLNDDVTIHYNYVAQFIAVLSVNGNASNIKEGDSVTLNAYHNCGNGVVQYKFYYECNDSCILIRDFSTDGAVTWKPASEGTYTVYVDAKDSTGKVATSKLTVNVKAAQTALTAAMTAQYASPQTAGTTIKLTTSATGGTGSYQYKFYSECNGVWTKLWDYDTKNTYNWHATTVGTHTVYCDVKDSSGKVVCSNFKYQIVKGTDFVADLNANRISGQYTGTEIRLMAGSSNGSGTVQYKFYVEKDGVWTRLRDYAAQDYFLWTPTKAGYYNVYVDAKDSSGKIASKRLCITIEEGTPLKVTSLTANPSAPTAGSTVTLKGTTTGGESPVTYKFYYKLNDSWVKIQDFSSSNTCTFTPIKAGTYVVYVDAIDGKKNTQCLTITVTVK